MTHHLLNSTLILGHNFAASSKLANNLIFKSPLFWVAKGDASDLHDFKVAFTPLGFELDTIDTYLDA